MLENVELEGKQLIQNIIESRLYSLVVKSSKEIKFWDYNQLRENIGCLKRKTISF
jgi:hypothetical protein